MENVHPSTTSSTHYAEIIRPDILGQWAFEKNPALPYLHEAIQDWGERRGDPDRRPVCMTCLHEFHVNASMPSAWLFVRLSVNTAGVPRLGADRDDDRFFILSQSEWDAL